MTLTRLMFLELRRGHLNSGFRGLFYHSEIEQQYWEGWAITQNQNKSMPYFPV